MYMATEDTASMQIHIYTYLPTYLHVFELGYSTTWENQLFQRKLYNIGNYTVLFQNICHLVI